MALPPVENLFGGAPDAPRLSPAEVATRFDEFLSKVDSAPQRTITREEAAALGSGSSVSFDAPETPYASLTKALAAPSIVKSMSAESLASVTATLEQLKAQVPDLAKDISLTSPVSTGLVAFDLEAPAKMLTPRPTPLRNRVIRRKGVGTSHRFKKITGFTGTGTGGVGVLRPGIASTTQTNFAVSGSSNALYYNRGPKISYAGEDVVVPYIQFGVSDEVTWAAQYSGQGYQDIRQLSRTSLLYSSMLMEERVLLYGRGTASGFAGVLAAPTGVAVTARTAASNETALTSGTYIYVRVCAEMGDFGLSQASAVAYNASPTTTGQVVDVTYTLPAGATGARVFVTSNTSASDPGDASKYLYATRSGYNTTAIHGTLPTSASPAVTAWTDARGVAINLTSADGGSADANEYDGLWAYCSGTSAGYTNTLNTTLSTTSPGSEWQTGFASMYDSVKADPDRIMMSGQDRKQLSEAMRSGGSNSAYRLTVRQDELTGVSLGDVVTTIYNEVTGKAVDIEVHPWLPQGNSLIVSDTLPMPDSQVSEVFAVWNVQDLMGVDWPVNQFAYESSSYWYGTAICYAPGWLGSISGIKKS
jgi:hypothetical protein